MQHFKGLLAVWTDIPADLDYDLNEWYNREHMHERIIGVPGFIRGRRFVAFRGAPRYLAVYEAHSSDVVSSEPYRALVRDPDALSRRFIPKFQNTMKAIGDITVERGDAEGAVIAAVPITTTPGRHGALRSWLSDALLPDLLRSHGVVAARFAEQNPRILSAGTSEHMRATDKYLDALLMIEAVSETDLDAALPLLTRDDLAAHGAALDGEIRRLRVIYTLHVPPAPTSR